MLLDDLTIKETKPMTPEEEEACMEEYKQLVEYDNQKITIEHHKLSRIVLIGEQGIEREIWGVGVDLMVQDDGRTLKIWYAENK